MRNFGRTGRLADIVREAFTAPPGECWDDPQYGTDAEVIAACMSSCAEYLGWGPETMIVLVDEPEPGDDWDVSGSLADDWRIHAGAGVLCLHWSPEPDGSYCEGCWRKA